MTQRTGGGTFYAVISRCIPLGFSRGITFSVSVVETGTAGIEKVKVVLSGEGADEIFGGYVRYLPIAREWELQKAYPSYQYIFNKYYPSYLDGFAKITARNGNIELARDWLKPHFERFENPIHAMGFADFKLVMPSLLADGRSNGWSIRDREPLPVSRPAGD